MKTLTYLLLFSVLLLSGRNTAAQVTGDRYFYGQLSYSQVVLVGDYNQWIRYSTGGYGGSSGGGEEAVQTPALSIGYTRQIRRKWAFNWAADASAWRDQDYIERSLRNYLDSGPNPSAILRGAPRHLLTLNTRLQLFRTWSRPSAWRWSIGVGLSGMLRWHKYRSGYLFDQDTNQFEVETFTKERFSSLGVPIEGRLTVPLNTHWLVGASLGGEVYFNGDHRAYLGLRVIRQWY